MKDKSSVPECVKKTAAKMEQMVQYEERGRGAGSPAPRAGPERDTGSPDSRKGTRDPNQRSRSPERRATSKPKQTSPLDKGLPDEDAVKEKPKVAEFSEWIRTIATRKRSPPRRLQDHLLLWENELYLQWGQSPKGKVLREAGVQAYVQDQKGPGPNG